MLNNILILDTETTGLSPAKGAIMIEVCGILYNLKHKTILQVYSSLLPTETNDAEHVNMISPMVTKLPYSLLFMRQQIQTMAEHADALVAHNANFDKQFINAYWPEFSMKRWICTVNDFQWPVMLGRKRLQDVCQAMGVQYVDAHRALQDCLFIVQCFNKVQDLQQRFNQCWV